LTRLVVDASVVVKWFVPEVHAEAARGLLREDFSLSCPDLVRAEVGNVLWKKWRRDQLSSEAVEGILRDLENFTLAIETSEPLMGAAWNVARVYDRSFYDGLYVALAERAGCPLVTADRKLHNALKDGAYSDSVLWVGDVS
jgi:predicted nucleic acid-binding protein